jgi:conjugative transfer signal peptidase TraF
MRAEFFSEVTVARERSEQPISDGPTERSPRSASHTMKYRIVRNIAVVAVVVLVTPRLMKLSRLHFNETPSAPIGLYRESTAPMQRGQYVIASLPHEVVQLALARGYARPTKPVLKHIAARSGDRVVIGPQGISINGSLWPNSKPLAFDHAGRPLTHWPFGNYIVNPGEVWLLSDSPRGFDSRYFGSVPLSQINSTVYSVLTK